MGPLADNLNAIHAKISSNTQERQLRRSIAHCKQEDRQELFDEIFSAYMEILQKRDERMDDPGYIQTVIEKITGWLVSQDAHLSRSLLICGPVGSGKTSLVKAIRLASEHLQVKGKYWIPTMCSVTCLNFVEYLKKQEDIYELLKSHELLVFDDLGLEEPQITVYGTVIRPMERVIKQASDDNKSVIITTNLSKEGIRRQYDSDRMADCLNAYAVLNMEHESFRKL